MHWSGNNCKILTDYHATLHGHTETIVNHSRIINLFQLSFSQCKRGYEQFTGVCLRSDWNLVWVILGVLFVCGSLVRGFVERSFCYWQKSSGQISVFCIFRNVDVLLITCQEMPLQCPYALQLK